MARGCSRRPTGLFLALLALLVAALCLGGAAAQEDCASLKGKRCKKSKLCIKSGRGKGMTCTLAVTPEQQCAAIQVKKNRRRLCESQPVTGSDGSGRDGTCGCSKGSSAVASKRRSKKRGKCGTCIYVEPVTPTGPPEPAPEGGFIPINPDIFDLPSDSD